MGVSVVEEALDGLDAALDEAAAVSLGCLSGDEVLGWLCRINGLRARMEALVCEAMVAAGAAGVPALEGQRSVASVLDALVGADRKQTRADARLGSWVRGFPAFAEAFAGGRLSRRHLEVLRRVDKPRTTAALVDAQDYLVAAAQDCTWDAFCRAVRYWELAADPDGSEPDDHVEQRSARVTAHGDGSVSGRFRLDPVAGQAVISALDQEQQRLYRDDVESGATRTTTQRRADALTALITRGAGLPGGSIAAPLVHVVVGQELLESLLADGHDESGDAGPVTPDPVDPNRRCELIDGTPIHPRFALGVLAVASLRRIVLGARSEVLDLGRGVRAFPTHLKLALLVAARGHCQVRGCSAPFPWLQADHVHPWNAGGTTSTSNGQILCDPHNKAKRDTPPTETEED